MRRQAVFTCVTILTGNLEGFYDSGLWDEQSTSSRAKVIGENKKSRLAWAYIVVGMGVLGEDSYRWRFHRRVYSGPLPIFNWIILCMCVCVCVCWILSVICKFWILRTYQVYQWWTLNMAYRWYIILDDIIDLCMGNYIILLTSVTPWNSVKIKK